MGLYQKFSAGCDRLGRSRFFSPKFFQYGCAASGVICSLFFLLGFVISGLVPPNKPWWNPQETTDFMITHHKRINVGAALIVISGMFYLPLSAAISAQMRRIPNLHYSVSILQVASGAAGVWAFSLPVRFDLPFLPLKFKRLTLVMDYQEILLCVANYDLDRPVDITQALMQLFWLVAFMPWPTFLVQNVAFAYAILTDTRAKPLFPKWMAIVNVITPLCFVPASAMGVTRRGPLSWNGARSSFSSFSLCIPCITDNYHLVVTFWVPGMTFCLQLFIDSACLAIAVSNEPEGGEKIMDLFPTKAVDHQERVDEEQSRSSKENLAAQA